MVFPFTAWLRTKTPRSARGQARKTSSARDWVLPIDTGILAALRTIGWWPEWTGTSRRRMRRSTERKDLPEASFVTGQAKSEHASALLGPILTDDFVRSGTYVWCVSTGEENWRAITTCPLSQVIDYANTTRRLAWATRRSRRIRGVFPFVTAQRFGLQRSHFSRDKWHVPARG